jgi:hypothetical protein
MECRKLSLTEEINTLSELRKYLKDKSVAGKRNHSYNLYLDVDNNCLNQAVVFLSAHLVGKWTLNDNPKYNSEDGTDNYEPTEETVRDINDILELFASRYAVNIMYSIEQNKTMLFYIPEEYLEKESKSYVIQVKGKCDKWQTYKAFDSYLTAKIVDTKESLKANFLTWLYSIGNYESRIEKYERTTIRGNSKKTNRESCEQPY